MRWYKVAMRIWNEQKSEVEISEVITNDPPKNRKNMDVFNKYDEYIYYYRHLKDAIKQAEFLASAEDIEIKWIWDDDDLEVA